MDADEYVKEAARTKGGPYDIHKVGKYVLHGAIGLATESGELLDHLKRVIYYGQAFDPVKIMEELGDLMWYVACICDEMDLSLEQVMEQNIAKLMIRYQDKWNEKDAVVRDQDKERMVMEQTHIPCDKCTGECGHHKQEEDPDGFRPVTMYQGEIELDETTYLRLLAEARKSLPDAVMVGKMAELILAAMVRNSKDKEDVDNPS